MNTTQETKGRLRLLVEMLLNIRDNYGINNAQLVNFETAKGELEDIIDNMSDAPPPEPINVDGVVGGVMAGITGLQEAIDNSQNAAVAALGEKIDALITLANKAGEPAAA